MTTQEQELLEIGCQSIRCEMETLQRIASSLDISFAKAVERILECRGKVILTGMGKSGHIARKIAATLTSTGTPSLFLHPAEASHGDMGIITAEDVILALSFSGETDELRDIVAYASELGTTLIAITGNASSYLAQRAQIHILTAVEREDCVINAVPMSSTVAQLAIGDAIATTLMYRRNFHAEEFAHLHPGGHIEERIEANKNNK
ncbi:MAG: SIS domain-containing protein [Alistipes sp.]|nr:SIS domain-containing protein [Alistipes sp.]